MSFGRNLLEIGSPLIAMKGPRNCVVTRSSVVLGEFLAEVSEVCG